MVSTVSSGRHRCGCCLRARYSKGRDCQVVQAGVHALGVGRQDLQLAGTCGGDDGLGPAAEPMPPVIAIAVQQCGAQQRGQFAGRGAALHVHLEEAVLGVEVAQGTHGIAAAGSGDVRHTQRVAGHRHGGLCARQDAPAVEAGQAAAAGRRSARGRRGGRGRRRRRGRSGRRGRGGAARGDEVGGRDGRAWSGTSGMGRWASAGEGRILGVGSRGVNRVPPGGRFPQPIRPTRAGSLRGDG